MSHWLHQYCCPQFMIKTYIANRKKDMPCRRNCLINNENDSKSTGYCIFIRHELCIMMLIMSTISVSHILQEYYPSSYWPICGGYEGLVHAFIMNSCNQPTEPHKTETCAHFMAHSYQMNVNIYPARFWNWNSQGHSINCITITQPQTHAHLIWMLSLGKRLVSWIVLSHRD